MFYHFNQICQCLVWIIWRVDSQSKQSVWLITNIKQMSLELFFILFQCFFIFFFVSMLIQFITGEIRYFFPLLINSKSDLASAMLKSKSFNASIAWRLKYQDGGIKVDGVGSLADDSMPKPCSISFFSSSFDWESKSSIFPLIWC